MFLEAFRRGKSAKIALPLHRNRIAVTLQSRCRYGETALRLRCNGNAIWLLSQKKLAEKPPTALSRGRRLPFSSSKRTGFQVLNFGNNILQFSARTCCLSWINTIRHQCQLSLTRVIPGPRQNISAPIYNMVAPLCRRARRKEPDGSSSSRCRFPVSALSCG